MAIAHIWSHSPWIAASAALLKNRFSEPLEMASREGRFGLPIYRSAIPILCIPISILCIPICVSAKRGLTLEQLRRHVQC